MIVLYRNVLKGPSHRLDLLERSIDRGLSYQWIIRICDYGFFIMRAFAAPSKPIWMYKNLLFLWKTACVDTNHTGILFSIGCSPNNIGNSSTVHRCSVVGRRIAQLFRPANKGSFLLFPLDSGKCDTTLFFSWYWKPGRATHWTPSPPPPIRRAESGKKTIRLWWHIHGIPHAYTVHNPKSPYRFFASACCADFSWVLIYVCALSLNSKDWRVYLLYCSYLKKVLHLYNSLSSLYTFFNNKNLILII